MPRKRMGYDAACYYDGKLLGRCTKADSDAYLMKKLKYVNDIQQPMIFVWNIIGVIVGLGICMIIEYRNIKKTSSLKIK